jgi:hypothetical protein
MLFSDSTTMILSCFSMPVNLSQSVTYRTIARCTQVINKIDPAPTVPSFIDSRLCLFCNMLCLVQSPRMYEIGGTSLFGVMIRWRQGLFSSLHRWHFKTSQLA